MKENIEKINNLLYERDKESPKKFSKNEILNKELDDFFNKLDKQYIVDKTFLKEGVIDFISRPIFICGNMKSGTTMLTHLLDGHSELFVLPGDSHFVNNYFYNNIDKKKTLRYWFKRFINPTGQKPFWFLGENVEGYIKFIANFEFFSKKYSIFESIVLSSMKARKGNKQSPKHWVEKTPSNELHYNKLIKRYPRAKFIHIVRDPISNISSLKKKNNIVNENFSITKNIFDLRFLFSNGAKHRLNKNYIVVRYEDILKEPEKEMRGISDFLSIQFDKILLKPTVGGFPASSNSMNLEGRTVGKINKNNLLEKNNKLSKRE